MLPCYPSARLVPALCRPSPAGIQSGAVPADDLTPAQVAELLGVDQSTLRRWARQFKAHLSSQAQGKRRRYSSADLGMLSRARDLLRVGKSPAEVDSLLATLPQAAPQVPAVAAVSLPAMAGELQAAQEALRAALARVEALQQAQDKLKAAQEAQAAQIVQQQIKIDQLWSRLEEWEALPWWRRLFGPGRAGGK